MEETAKRFSGRRVTIGFGLFLFSLLMLVLALWLYGRSPAGPIRTFAPIDEARVLLVREGFEQKHLLHLTARHIERGQLWSVPFHGIPRGARPLVVGSRVLLFVTNEVDGVELDGHSLADGSFEYRAFDFRIPEGVTPSVTMLAVGERVVAAYHAAQTHVVVVDATNGTVVADHIIEGSAHLPSLRVAGSSVVVHPRMSPELRVDPISGAMTVLPPGIVPPARAPERVELPFRLNATLGGQPSQTLAPMQAGSVYWIVSGTSVAAIDGNGRVLGSDGPVSFATHPREAP